MGNLHSASEYLYIVKIINSYTRIVVSLVLIMFICFIQENHSTKKTSQLRDKAYLHILLKVAIDAFEKILPGAITCWLNENMIRLI